MPSNRIHAASLAIASPIAALIFLAAASSGCKKEEPLPEWESSEATGVIEVVESARPEGGSEGTFAVSDLTRPPVDGDVGWWPSVAVASSGTVHVAYTDAYNGALHHAERVDGEWQVTPVDSFGAVGKYPALALASDGTPHVIYYNQDNRLLRHATRAGEAAYDPQDRRRPPNAPEDWEYEIVDQGLEIGMAGRLLLASDGTLHAVYYGPGQRLIHSHRKPTEPGQRGRWARRVVDRDAAGSHSIVIGLAEDADGGLHISYSNWLVARSELRYGHLPAKADEWEVTPVDKAENAGWKSGLVIDERGRPVVAYLLLQKREIHIARLEDGAWTHWALVGDANTMDVSFGPDGALLIAYEHLPGRGLRGATVRYLLRDGLDGDLGEEWKDWSVPGGEMSTYLSAALAPSGQPVFAFYRGDIRGLSVFEGRDTGAGLVEVDMEGATETAIESDID